MTQHDPTDEAETIPGIPIAGSDLEKFPSVAPIIGGAQSLDVSIQHIISSGGGTFAAPTTITITAVDTSRTYVIVQGSVQPPLVSSGSTTSWQLEDFSIVWELTNSTTVSWWRNSTGLTQRVRFAVIEYL